VRLRWRRERRSGAPTNGASTSGGAISYRATAASPERRIPPHTGRSGDAALGTVSNEAQSEEQPNARMIEIAFRWGILHFVQDDIRLRPGDLPPREESVS